MLITSLYLATFLISVVLIGRLLVRNKNVDSAVVVFAVLIMINNLGRFLVSTSTTLEVAILANKILYFGGCYLPVMLIVVMTNFCKIKVPKIVRILFVLIPSIIFTSVLTIGYNGLYYEKVELAFGDGYSYLVKDYGPMHPLFIIYTISCCVIYIAIIAYTIFKKKNVSLRMLMLTGGLGVLVASTYVFQSLLKSKFEWVSVTYLFAVALLTAMVERLNMFDMSTNIARSVKRIQENGYIVFDKKNRYINCNELVQTLFPEIISWKPDEIPPWSDTVLFNDVVAYCLENPKEMLNGERKKRITLDKRCFELSLSDIFFNKKNVGYLIELVDCTAEKQYLESVERYNNELQVEVEKQTENVVYIKDMMVMGLATMVEGRDSSTGGHIRRTSKVVEVFSRKLLENEKELGLSESFLKMVAKAAPMHDLGKIAVRDSILQKQGRFTDEEYAEMKKHASAGGKIVDEILNGVEDEEFVEIARNVANYHHEKFDGTGYPSNLKGEEIPIEARIMALADVFDALVSKRCYKEAYSYDKAFSIISESRGTHFDAELCDYFIECRDQLEELYDSFD